MLSSEQCTYIRMDHRSRTVGEMSILFFFSISPRPPRFTPLQSNPDRILHKKYAHLHQPSFPDLQFLSAQLDIKLLWRQAGWPRLRRYLFYYIVEEEELRGSVPELHTTVGSRYRPRGSFPVAGEHAILCTPYTATVSTHVYIY